MAKIKIRYSMAAGATAPIGLTAGELAVNITQRRMFVGDTAGNTVELAGLSANNFTGLNSFAAGISAAGGVTFAGSLSGTTAAFSRLVTAQQGISAAGGVTLASTLRVNGQANFETSTFFNANIAVDSIDSNASSAVSFPSSYIHALVGISTNGATLSGIVTAPTQANGSNNTRVATTAFVANNSVARLNGISGGITLNAGTNISITSSVAGGITVSTNFKDIVLSVNGITGDLAISGGQGITTAKPSANQIKHSVNFYEGGESFPSKTRFSAKDILLFQESSTTERFMYIASVTALKNYILGVCGGCGGAGGVIQSLSFSGFSGPGVVGGETLDSYIVGFTALQSAINEDCVTRFNGRTGSVQGVSAAVAGSGISVSAATGSVTISNTGVLSFNGAVGAVTGASLGANTFTGLQTSATGFSGPLTGNATTATNSTQLGGVAAASYALLASPTFTGTPASTTAAVGTNTTQIATTAFVQNEIVADTVTSFNGRTGAVQGVSAAVAGNGITVSGATGSVTITNAGVTRAVAGTGISVNANTGTVTITNSGVQSFNGNTGAVTGASLGANTFNGLQTINSGGLYVNGGGTTFGASQGVVFEYGLRQTRVISNIDNAGGLIVDRGTTLGSASGAPLTVRGGPLNLLNNSIFNVYTGTTVGTGNCPLNVYASGNIGLYTSNPSGGVGLGTYAELLLNAGTGNADGSVTVNGSDLVLGTKSANGEDYTTVALEFTGTSFPIRYTTLTANPSGSDKTITLPNESGTVALETKSNARGWFM
jgi:hypothetical protein